MADNNFNEISNDLLVKILLSRLGLDSNSKDSTRPEQSPSSSSSSTSPREFPRLMRPRKSVSKRPTLDEVRKGLKELSKKWEADVEIDTTSASMVITLGPEIEEVTKGFYNVYIVPSIKNFEFDVNKIQLVSRQKRRYEAILEQDIEINFPFINFLCKDWKSWFCCLRCPSQNEGVVRVNEIWLCTANQISSIENALVITKHLLSLFSRVPK